jgi:hypothetical protein
MKGYRQILSREEIVNACDACERGVFVPKIASAYNLTLNQCIHMLKKENCGKYIKFEKYGNKKYNWRDPEIKKTLSMYIANQLNDDEIARLMRTSYFAISKGRSIAGLVAYNRIIAKGHHSKHTHKHLVGASTQMTFASFNEAIDNDIENINIITEKGKGSERVIINTADEAIIQKPIRTQDMIVCFESDDISPLVKKTLVDKMTWRGVACRIQDPNCLYRIKNNEEELFYKLHFADPTSGLVELKLVRRITCNQA